MKRRIAAGLLASVPVLIVLAVALQSKPQRPSREDGAPHNKFGFTEAMTSSPPTYDRVAARSVATSVDIVAPSPTAPPRTDAQNLGIPAADLAVSLPKIAYRYSYGFSLDPRNLADVQRAHADMCERLGPATCRIVAMEHDADGAGAGSGTLDLAVASPRARSFAGELARQVSEAGGEQASSSITGEDLSKQIVDTEARLRARTVLRDRLMDVLTSRRGTVAELVEAERGVAQVNEEIDQARSWLNEMKGRVEYSALHIAYNPAAAIRAERQGGFTAPIRAVVGALGSIFGMAVAAIIGILALFAPFALLFWAGLKAWRRLRPATIEEAVA